MKVILKQNQRILIAFFAIVLLLALAELGMGRSPLGPDGRFGVWDGDIWGSENSQRMLDVYSFSHIIHGMLFFGVLWWVARQMPVERRFLIAALMEAGWEMLENSPIIINRYRAATIAQGYDGDSILNSSCDLLMMAAGFLIAQRVRPRTTIAAIVIMEVGCAWWVRDNLTLNLIMLIHPVEAIKQWQLAGHPMP